MRASSGDFNILGFDTDNSTGVVRLRYGYEKGGSFCETLSFGAPLPGDDSPFRHAFEEALAALLVLSGVSYYKAFAPDTVVVHHARTTPDRLPFFKKLYVEGLGEFAYRNNIDIAGRLNFARAPLAAAATSTGARPHPALPRRSAVLIGGGKDSLVSVEALRAASEPMTLFAVNPKRPMTECAEASGLPLISVSRQLDSGLFELNKAGALNGHVPITAIVSFIAIAASFVHGFDAVVLSNERSADEGTVERDGVSINHQFSKSSGAEADIADYVKTRISADLAYFSLLRPLSEAHIARLFARVDRYDHVFTSCNRAFQLLAKTEPARWCLDCPKCRFTFLMLATAMPAARLRSIFGADLLDDARQSRGYEELSGLAGHKPWECVGEIAESSAALLMLARDPAWADSAVVRSLAPRLAPHAAELDRVWTRLMTPSADHFLSPRFESALHDYIGR